MLVQRPNPRSSGPQRYGVEQLGPAGAGAPPDPQLLQRLLSGSALIKLEQTGALRRCPPARWQLPAQQPAGLRAKRVCCHTLSCRVHSSGEQLGGLAELPRRRCTLPARHSTVRLSRFKQKLAGECCWSTPLPQASCAAGELICRRAGRGASYGPEKLRPEEAALALDTKAGAEGQGGRGADVRLGCGAASPRNVRTS